MRRIYSRSDETFKVLSGHESGIAREMEVDVSYINKIKNGVEPDRYPPFREIFRAACNTPAPVETWLNDLMGIYTRSRKGQVNLSELSDKLLEKLQSDDDTLKEILRSTSDHQLDKSECHKILARLHKNFEINKAIEQIVLNRLGEISEKEGK